MTSRYERYRSMGKEEHHIGWLDEQVQAARRDTRGVLHDAHTFREHHRAQRAGRLLSGGNLWIKDTSSGVGGAKICLQRRSCRITSSGVTTIAFLAE